MPKKKRPFVFTTARIRMVQVMQAHRQSVEEIADALGCSVETVTDFLLSQVDGTGPAAAPNQLFRMAAMVDRRAVAMSAGYQVVVSDTANPRQREWVETARGSQEGKELCDYLNPRLPEGKKATSQWEAFDPAMPRFDVAKLVEKANEPEEEGE